MCLLRSRDVHTDLSRALAELIEDLILYHGVTEFWTGGMGSFDGCFASEVLRLKKKYPNIKLILVKPYFSNKLNTYKEYYERIYDDIIIPDLLSSTPRPIKAPSFMMGSKGCVYSQSSPTGTTSL